MPSLWCSLQFNLADLLTPPLHFVNYTRYNRYKIAYPLETMVVYPKTLAFKTFALANGQQRPLCLVLKFGATFEDVPSSEIYALIPILLPHISRLRHVIFQGPLGAFKYLPDLPPDSFPILETLYIPAETWQIYDNKVTEAPFSPFAPACPESASPSTSPSRVSDINFPSAT